MKAKYLLTTLRMAFGVAVVGGGFKIYAAGMDMTAKNDKPVYALIGSGQVDILHCGNAPETTCTAGQKQDTAAFLTANNQRVKGVGLAWLGLGTALGGALVAAGGRRRPRNPGLAT